MSEKYKITSTYRMPELLKYFSDKEIINTNEVYSFYKRYDHQITRAAVLKRIARLIEKEYLQRVARGKYQLIVKNEYKPLEDPQLSSISKKLKRYFPFLEIVVWTTKQLNEFMLHQPNNFNILVETEREASEYVFNFLQTNYKNVFLNPKKEETEKYILNLRKSIIVKNLVSEAPIIALKSYKTATLEKILVDIFCDNRLFVAQQGAELATIYQTVFEKYVVNKGQLLRYAQRRRRKTKLIDFLEDMQIKLNK